MFIGQELQNALTKARKKHPKVVFDKHLVRMFIGKMGELKEKWGFKEARRYALNECGIWDKEVRNAYASLAGVYFGRRGGVQTARRKAEGKISYPAQTQKSRRMNTPRVNKKGQYEFDI